MSPDRYIYHLTISTGLGRRSYRHEVSFLGTRQRLGSDVRGGVPVLHGGVLIGVARAVQSPREWLERP
jgi:hypothetical protein